MKTNQYKLAIRRLLGPCILLASLTTACEIIVAPPGDDSSREPRQRLPPEDEPNKDTSGDGDISISDDPRTPGCDDLPDDAHDLEIPRYTLTDGYEFVDLNWAYLLARRENHWRAFEFRLCSLTELSLPEDVQGMDLKLQFQSILACGAEGCSALHRAEETPSQDMCALPGWEIVQEFESTTLIGYENLGASSCWWSETAIQCTGTEPVAPPEGFEIVTVGEGPCVYNFDGRRCHNGSTWGNLESDRALTPSALPPEPSCGGILRSSYNDEIWEVTEDGVFIKVSSEGNCTARTDPLGTPVALGAYFCACARNPVLVTATQFFATCECFTCT